MSTINKFRSGAWYRIPRGAYCVDEVEASFVREDGVVMDAYCGTYEFPNGNTAGWLLIDSEDGVVVHEQFLRP